MFCRRDASVVLKDFKNGVRYVKLSTINNGSRVLDRIGRRKNEFVFIVTGDVTWCELRGQFVVGFKARDKRPAEWMDDEWDTKEGYFLVNPSKLGPNDVLAADAAKDAVTWFEDREELDRYSSLTSSEK